MIRFSASLVVVGVGLLVAGSVTSRLLLIYIAIGVSAVALVFLIIGAIVNRAELLGHEPAAIGSGQTDRADQAGYADELDQAPEPAATTAVGAGAARGFGRKDGSGFGAAPPAERPTEAPFPGQLVHRDSAGQPSGQGFAGYEQFAPDAERRRPGEPPRPERGRPERPQGAEPPFVEPEPTRMDWAAGLAEAERQERERSGQRRPERDRKERPPSSPQSAERLFVEPEPTRMDWAAGLAEAERQERERSGQDRPGRDRKERDRPGSGRPERRPGEPEPTRMDWAPGLRERGSRGPVEAGEPGRPGEQERPGPTAPAGPSARPGERPVQATRAEKIIAGPPEGEAKPRPESEAKAETRAETPEKALAGKPEARTDEPGEGQDSGAPAAATMPAKAAAEPAETAGPTEPAEPAGSTSPAARAGADASETSSPTSDPPGPESVKSPESDKSPAVSTDKPSDSEKPGDSPAKAKDADRDDADGPAPKDGVASDQDVTVVPGVPRYHRSECILIRFMGDNDLQRMRVEQAREAGCTPCRACQPDGEQDD